MEKEPNKQVVLKQLVITNLRLNKVFELLYTLVFSFAYSADERRG